MYYFYGRTDESKIVYYGKHENWTPAFGRWYYAYRSMFNKNVIRGFNRAKVLKLGQQLTNSGRVLSLWDIKKHKLGLA